MKIFPRLLKDPAFKKGYRDTLKSMLSISQEPMMPEKTLKASFAAPAAKAVESPRKALARDSSLPSYKPEYK